VRFGVTNKKSVLLSSNRFCSPNVRSEVVDHAKSSIRWIRLKAEAASVLAWPALLQ